MFNLLHVGDWTAQQVRLTWAAHSSRPLVPEVEQQIEQTWQQVRQQRPDVRLFDGPMCRLESVQASAGGLHLTLSRTSYKPFLGTNLRQARELAGRCGRDVLANPLGLSAVLLSADGFLLMGRRNNTVAYYPNRIHPFAGSLEPQDHLDAFAGIGRELREELSLGPDDVQEMACAGLVEDRTLLQPELIFLARCRQDRAAVTAQADAAEHRGLWSVPATPEAMERAIRSSEPFTPVAVATLLLWGRRSFGEEWFAAQKPGMGAG